MKGFPGKFSWAVNSGSGAVTLPRVVIQLVRIGKSEKGGAIDRIDGQKNLVGERRAGYFGGDNRNNIKVTV